MEFFTGMLVGFIVAGLIGRAKFLQVQNKLRELRDEYMNERSISAGLEQELAAAAKVV
jgi:hypothetical protein